MTVRTVLAGALFALAGLTSASADTRIYNDRGGRIEDYISRFSALRQSGERVIVDGPCLSACTMVLGAVPRSRICVTPRATFGFHAAWLPTGYGSTVRSPLGDRVLWASYPPAVRQWINRHGGLSRRLILLRGQALTAMYPTCI